MSWKRISGLGSKEGKRTPPRPDGNGGCFFLALSVQGLQFVESPTLPLIVVRVDQLFQLIMQLRRPLHELQGHVQSTVQIVLVAHLSWRVASRVELPWLDPPIVLDAPGHWRKSTLQDLDQLPLRSLTNLCRVRIAHQREVVQGLSATYALLSAHVVVDQHVDRVGVALLDQVLNFLPAVAAGSVTGFFCLTLPMPAL